MRQVRFPVFPGEALSPARLGATKSALAGKFMTSFKGVAADLADRAPAPGVRLGSPIKVGLVESHPRVRESWVKVINSFPNFACHCAFATGEEALLDIPRKRPDVVLTDIFLPRMSGIECTARLKQLLPAVPIVIFTEIKDEEMVFRALEAGADGYLLKPTEPVDLRMALLKVLRGGVPLTGQIARQVVKSFRQNVKTCDKLKCLTLREEWILMLLCQGHSNHRIAEKLDLSIYTICTHLKGVFRKLKVSSRTGAVVYYQAAKARKPEPPRVANGFD